MKVRHLGGLPIAMAVMLLGACGGNDAASTHEAASPSAAVDTAAPQAAPEPVAAEPSPGQKAYESTCVMCHGSPAVGAPVLGNKDDWAPRIAQGKDVLYTHALEGFTGQKGAMPARGGNPSLDDDKIKAAVDYMVGKAQ